MTPELHRPLPLDRIPPHGHESLIEASPAECAALAQRLRLPGVRALTCRFWLHKLPGGNVAATGHLRARVVQTCIVSLDDFAALIDERFAIRFVPAGTETEADDPESDDKIPYDGISIDLGEAAAEQLALVLAPYPRRPDAELPETPGEAEISPFAALAALRRKT